MTAAASARTGARSNQAASDRTPSGQAGPMALTMDRPWLAALAAIFLAELILLAVVAGLNPLAINPDAIAYMRIAEYYSGGRFDLAVNGYWGPLISWLIAALLAVTPNTLTAMRLAMAASAVVFTAGALLLLVALGLNRAAIILATATTALFASAQSVAWVTPDLLMAGLLLSGLALTLWAGGHDIGRRPLISGLFYGSAFLAKAPALPIALASLAIVALVRVSLAGIPWRRAIAQSAWAIAGLAIVVLPWMLVLSFHYGTPTLSTSGAINHAIVGPPNVARAHPTFSSHLWPAPGRLTTWEEPSRLAYLYWSPFADKEAFRHQIKIITGNAAVFLQRLSEFDLLGVAPLAVLAAFLLGLRRQRLVAQPWRLAVIPIVVNGLIYFPVFGGAQRYYFACLPLLLAGASGLAHDLAPRNKRLSGRAVGLLVTALLFLPTPLAPLSFALAGRFDRPAFEAATILVQATKPAIPGSGAVAGVADQMRVALYLSYVTGRPYLGDNWQETSVDHLGAMGVEYVVTDKASALDQVIRNPTSSAGSYAAIEIARRVVVDWPVVLYRIVPAASTEPGGARHGWP